MLPARKPRPRSGIARAPRRDWPRHEAFVRRHECSNPQCPTHGDPHAVIEFAHLSYGLPAEDSAGKGMKAHSAWGISLCEDCHRQAHQRGHRTCFTVWGINPHKLAVEFARTSPIPDIREKASRMSAWVRNNG